MHTSSKAVARQSQGSRKAVARAGLLLLSQFQNKPQPDSRRDMGYEKDAVRNVGLAEDSVRRQRRALGYDDPPPDA